MLGNTTPPVVVVHPGFGASHRRLLSKAAELGVSLAFCVGDRLDPLVLQVITEYKKRTGDSLLQGTAVKCSFFKKLVFSFFRVSVRCFSCVLIPAYHPGWLRGACRVRVVRVVRVVRAVCTVRVRGYACARVWV